MIPKTSMPLRNGIKIVSRPTRTYRLSESSVMGFCDGLEALKQTIEGILNTERYEHIIFSRNYGVELKDLYGRDKDFVMASAKRRIQEALIQDDRIQSVDDFEFSDLPGALYVSFVVHSTLGDLPGIKEVIYRDV